MTADTCPQLMTQQLDLGALADAANAAHARAERHARLAVAEAWRAGHALLAAKAQLPHGRWLPWLAENFNGSARTANAYARIARAHPDASPTGTLAAVLRDLAPRSAVAADFAGDLTPAEAARLAELEGIIDRAQAAFPGTVHRALDAMGAGWLPPA